MSVDLLENQTINTQPHTSIHNVCLHTPHLGMQLLLTVQNNSEKRDTYLQVQRLIFILIATEESQKRVAAADQCRANTNI